MSQNNPTTVEDYLNQQLALRLGLHRIHENTVYNEDYTESANDIDFTSDRSLDETPDDDGNSTISEHQDDSSSVDYGYDTDADSDFPFNTDDAILDARDIVRNFSLMSVLMSSTLGCVFTCLSLATARLGSVGAWQSGVLFLTYTGSAVFGATYVVKTFGSRNALILGMGMYFVYIATFWVATKWQGQKTAVALTGAAIGGIGAGFLWTAQGAYFARAAEDHSFLLNQPNSVSTSKLAGIFAFIYLTSELTLRSLSSILQQFAGMDWNAIFGMYALIALLSTGLMFFVHQFDERNEKLPGKHSTTFHKATVAWRLLRESRKIKYLIGMNAVFGLATAFLNSFVNGDVTPTVLNDQESKYVGILTAYSSAVAALSSILFGRASQFAAKGAVLIFGANCFFSIAFAFLVQPNIDRWTWIALASIYTTHGIGRATFEGPLRATFADFFPLEKEGAFANIILQNGLSSALGYVLSFSLKCNNTSWPYCVQYLDGSKNNVLVFELLIGLSAILAVVGYLKASVIHAAEESTGKLDAIRRRSSVMRLGAGVSSRSMRLSDALRRESIKMRENARIRSIIARSEELSKQRSKRAELVRFSSEPAII